LQKGHLSIKNISVDKLGDPVELLFGFGFFQQFIKRVAFLYSYFLGSLIKFCNLGNEIEIFWDFIEKVCDDVWLLGI